MTRLKSDSRIRYEIIRQDEDCSPTDLVEIAAGYGSQGYWRTYLLSGGEDFDHVWVLANSPLNNEQLDEIREDNK